MDKLRVGVVGLGVGERHVVGYHEVPGVEVVAVCDLDEQRLHEVADRHHVERRSTDFRAVTEADDLDVVSICSYDDVHAKQAISAFRHGKHVMVEKPVALRRDDAEALLRAQQESGKVISSNLILRASPRFQEVRRMVQAGELGEVFYLEGDYLHDILRKITDGWRGRMDFYCVVYGGGIHLIDLMRWILGAEVEEVIGMGTGILTRGTSYRFPDTIVNLLRFDTGAVAKTTTCYGPRRPKFHALDVYGTEATFSNDVPHGRLWTSDRPEDLREVTSAYPGMEKGDLLPKFVEAIRAGVEPDVGAVDVFRVLDICLAAWESVESNQPVKVAHLL